jgi:hypothetical protein
MAFRLYPLTGKNTKKEPQAGAEILRSLLKAELRHILMFLIILKNRYIRNSLKEKADLEDKHH